jgi:hypothetical protein
MDLSTHISPQQIPLASTTAQAHLQHLAASLTVPSAHSIAITPGHTAQLKLAAAWHTAAAQQQQLPPSSTAAGCCCAACYTLLLLLLRLRLCSSLDEVCMLPVYRS